MSENKKGLLNEGTIRRFMKLAEIDKLSDGFVSGLVQEAAEEVEEGMGMKAYARHEDDEEKKDLEEDAVEEGSCGQRDDGDLEEMAHEAGARHEDEMDPEEAPMAAAEPAAELADAVEKLMAVVSDLTGVDIAVDAGEEEEAAPEMDMEPAEDDLEMADEPMMEDEEFSGVELEEDVDEDAMVAEITRRVAARLQKESRNEQLATDLTEKIMARLKESTQK